MAPAAGYNCSMDDKAKMKLWVETWKQVGPLLDKIRHQELRAMTDADGAAALGMLSEFALSLPDQQTRTTSGFVEQQRLFMKLRAHGSPV